MKHTALVALGLVVAACAHDERPVAPSAAAVNQSTNTPSNTPDFTPPENQVGDLDTERESPTSVRPGSAATDFATVRETPTGTTGTVGTARAPAAEAIPPDPGKKPDNSATNTRDRDGTSLTPMDQGGSEADRKITQQIRQAVMKDSSLSFTAKNVKIITVDGKVTLRGPVKSAAERAAIEAAAKNVAGVAGVHNDLEIAN